MEINEDLKKRKPSQLFNFEPDCEEPVKKQKLADMPKHMISDFTMTLAAPRRSGKTHFIIMLLGLIINSYDKIFIFSPSLDFSADFQEFADNPKVELVTDPDENLIKGIFKNCAEAQRQAVNNERQQKRKLRGYKVLTVFDDMIDSGLFHFGGLLDKFAERGRHIKLTLVASAQRISAISRSIRLNSDYFIIFSPYSISELEQFIEQFVSKSFRKEIRLKIAEIFETPYNFLIVDNTEKNPRKKLKVSNADSFMKGILTPLLE